MWQAVEGSHQITWTPISVGAEIWTISRSRTMYGLSTSIGSAVSQLALGSSPANHVPTPSVGDGLLLAPGSDQVIAYRQLNERGPGTRRRPSSPTPGRPVP